MINEIKTSFNPRLRNLRSIRNLESAITQDSANTGLYELTSRNPKNYLQRSALKDLNIKVVKIVSQIVPVALTYYQRY